ncbi:MAG: glycosyltransferase family 1 protein [Anaerolineae bacterium]|jgi:glycosyltransferase involved in cell wall biosynthesis
MRLALNAWFWDRPATGSGQYARRLVKALAALSPDLEIVLVIPLEPSGDEELRPLDSPGSCVYHPIPFSRSNLAKVIFEQVAFPRACARVEADVAHVPYWGAPARSPVPLLVTIHDLIPLLLRNYRGGPLQRLYTALVSATARGADLALTDSEASRRDILERLALPRQRVRVIPLAVDDQYGPKPAAEDESIRADYGLRDRYVLYLGGFDRRKDLATVLAAYRWADPAIGQRYPLVIAGRLPERDTTFTPDPRRLMGEENVPEESVHFIGFVDEADKPALYRGAAAFIFPSRYEGFGLPPLEALACGTPVVASDASSLPEIVGDAGILLPPGDARGMAGALIRLIDDVVFRAQLSRRAVERAATFSWARTAKATLAAYRAVQP